MRKLDTKIFRGLHGRPFLGKETHKEDIIKMNHSEYDVRMLMRKNGQREERKAFFTVTAELSFFSRVGILLTTRKTLYQRLIITLLCGSGSPRNNK
jgi:hypothetical protein